ncbi:MAG: hypothetical protein CMF55_06020 [Legionellales bacterium]|nr:hypothetical protein [Legionellales bacterium]
MDLKAAASTAAFMANSNGLSGAKDKNVTSDVGINQVKQRENQAIEYGYNQVIKSMATSNIRGNAINRMDDGIANHEKIGMLNLNAMPSNGPKSVAVELTTIRRDTISMMNKLPAEINILVADEIKQQIKRNKFPTNVEEVNKKIHEISTDIFDQKTIQKKDKTGI